MTTTSRIPTAEDRDRIARLVRSRVVHEPRGGLPAGDGHVLTSVIDGSLSFLLVSDVLALLDIAEAAEAAAEEARGEMGGTAADRRAFRQDYPATARLADLFPARG